MLLIMNTFSSSEPIQESTTEMESPTNLPQVATTATDLSMQPTIALDLSTDLPTTAMDLSTDLPTTAMDLSTDLPTTPMDLSTDLLTTAMDLSTDSFQTISASTLFLRTMGVSPEPEADKDRLGGKPTVTIVAGICGGITGILIVAILCVCIACIAKRIQVHVHYDGEEKSDSRHQENTSGTVLPINTADRQAAPTSNIGPIQNQMTIPSNGHSMQHNLAYGSQTRMYEGTKSGSAGDYERMSGYLAFHHGNQTDREEEICSHLALPMVHVMPVQQGQSNTYTGKYDDEHAYEYIQ